MAPRGMAQPHVRLGAKPPVAQARASDARYNQMVQDQARGWFYSQWTAKHGTSHGAREAFQVKLDEIVRERDPARAYAMVQALKPPPSSPPRKPRPSWGDDWKAAVKEAMAGAEAHQREVYDRRRRHERQGDILGRVADFVRTPADDALSAMHGFNVAQAPFISGNLRPATRMLNEHAYALGIETRPIVEAVAPRPASKTPAGSLYNTFERDFVGRYLGPINPLSMTNIRMGPGTEAGLEKSRRAMEDYANIGASAIPVGGFGKAAARLATGGAELTQLGARGAGLGRAAALSNTRADVIGQQAARYQLPIDEIIDVRPPVPRSQMVAEEVAQVWPPLRRDGARELIAAAPGTGGVELAQLSSLTRRQAALHDLLPEPGSFTLVPRRKVSMANLRSLGQVTGDEYNMFTRGGRRLVVRGRDNEIRVSEGMRDDLLAGRYGKFSGHTHPPGYDIEPSAGDREFLTKMQQERSGIWGDSGYTVFGRIAAEDPIIQAQIRRARSAKLYGGN